MSHDPGQPRPDADPVSVPTFGVHELEPRLLLSASYYDPQEVLPVGSSQDEVVALAAGDVTFGIDVSKWQGTINWATVANSTDIEFVFTKATQGVNYVDPKFVTNINGAHNAGLLVGGYHFATPYTDGIEDAADEASDFYDAMQPYLTDGYLRPVLDLEGTNSLSVTAMSNWVHDFMNTFSSLSGGIVPIIYTGTSYAKYELNSSVNIYDLWFPIWPSTPDFDNPPAAPGIWSGKGYDLWQYSATTSVPGISGNVDGDVFLGDINELIAKYSINTTPDDHGDDVAGATVVSVPSTTAGVIGTLADSDWFKLTLEGATDYAFSMLADGLLSGELRLYSDTGTLITSNTGPAVGDTLAEIQFTTVVGGVYYLSVDSSGAGGYELAVQEADEHGDSINTATDLSSFGLGGLQTATDLDYFRFTAEAGKLYSFEVFNAGLPDAVLTLYNGSGIFVSQLSGAGGTPLAHLDWVASSGGDMYLQIKSNAGSLGDYAITLAATDLALTGDLNGDGFVGISDLNVVLGNWNQNVTAGVWSLGDPSGDGFVGIEDMNAVLGNWNAGSPPVVEAQSTSEDEIVASASGTQILGIDVSHWQSSINWASVAGSGKEFAFIRALDRDGLLDTRFHYNIVQSKANGIWAGAYQFVTPWTDGYNDAVEEATLFANTIMPYLTEGYLRPVIDIEAGPPHSPTPKELDNTVLTNWVHDYMTTFVSLTGIEPLIYTNTDHAKVAFDTGINTYDLWLANWTNNPDSPPTGNADGVWNGYDFWQYSATTNVPGISGDVDGDVYFGSLSELIAEYGIVIAPDDHGNVLADATPVAIPSVAIGTVDTILDRDWFAVTLDSGEAYTFSLLGGTLGSADFTLYTNTGTVIATDSGPEVGGVLAQLQYTPTIGATYYIEVKTSGDMGTYGLTVQETDDHGDSITQATDLTGGIVLAGIQTNGDNDYYHFTAEAGKQYDFKLLDISIPDAVLTLYDAGGAIVDQQSGSNPGGTHSQLTWTATTAQEMYIAVSANPGSIGDYAMTLNVTDAPPIQAGDLDNDGFVGIGDLNIVLGNWNQNVTAGVWSLGDPSGDGFVGIEDMNTVLGNWNAGTPPVVVASSASQSQVTAMAVSQPTVTSDQHNDTKSTRGPRISGNGLAPEQVQNDALSHGLAIAIARPEPRSAFGLGVRSDFSPAFGLWEPDEVA